MLGPALHARCSRPRQCGTLENVNHKRHLAVLVLIVLIASMPIPSVSPRDGLYDEGDRPHGARHPVVIDAEPMVIAAPLTTVEEVTHGGSCPPLPVACLPFRLRAPPPE
jgi:hypothetical protein